MARSLIDDLQLDAADASVSVSTLLRKALLVAARTRRRGGSAVDQS